MLEFTVYINLLYCLQAFIDIKACNLVTGDKCSFLDSRINFEKATRFFHLILLTL